MSEEKKTLNLQDILKASDLSIIEEDVPEWGGKIKLKDWSGKVRDLFDQTVCSMAKDDVKGVHAFTVALSLANNDGSLLFVDDTKGEAVIDAEWVHIKEKNAKVLQRLANVITRRNFLGVVGFDLAGKDLPALSDENGSGSRAS